MAITFRKYLFAATVACASLSCFSLPAFSAEQAAFNDNAQHNAETKRAIIAVYNHWKGVHYRFGGDSKRGVDCSALMQHVFSDIGDIHLPRTTTEQIKLGAHINKSALQTGDLVFFRTSRYQRHVGIYLGNNAFMHASKLKGVTISSLENRYWARHYESARRIAEPGTV